MPRWAGRPPALPTAEQCLPERQMLPSLGPCRPGRLPPNTARQDVGSINSAAVTQWGQRGLESQARPAVGCHRSHRSTEVAARWMGAGHLRPQPLSGATPLGTTPPGRTLPTPAPAAHPDSPPSFRCPRQAGQEPEGLVKATLAGGHSIRAEGALLRFSGPGPGCSVPRDPHGPGSTPRGLHGPGCTPRPPGPYRGAQSPPLSRPPSTPSIEPSLSSGTPDTPRDFARLLLLPRDFSGCRPCWSHLLLEALPPPSPLRFLHHSPGPQPFPSEHVRKKLCLLSPLDCDHLPCCCGPGAQRNRGGPWGTDLPSPTGPCCLGPAGAPRRAGEGRSRWLRSHHRHGDR